MEKEIQGKNEAWNRLSGSSQSNPGNKMEYPSHTNSRGYSGKREEHAEGDKVGSDEDEDEGSDEDADEKRCGGRLRHRHAYGQVPGQPAMTQPSVNSQPVNGQQPMQPMAQPQQSGQFPQQQQPRPFRRGGMI